MDVDYEDDLATKAQFEKDCADPSKPDPKVLHEATVGTHAEGCGETIWVYLRRACNVCGHVECPCCPDGFCDSWPCIQAQHNCSYDLPPVDDKQTPPYCKVCKAQYPDENDESKFDSLGLPLHRCKGPCLGCAAGEATVSTDDDHEHCRRASGDLICDVCGKPYWKHPHSEHRDWNGEPWLNRICSGDLVKL